MKKTYIVAGVLVGAVAVLGGVLAYGELKREAPAPLVQQEILPQTDIDKVCNHMTRALTKIYSLSEVKDSVLMGEYLQECARELTMGAQALGDKEQSLRSYGLYVSEYVNRLGEKAKRGVELSDSEKNNIKEIRASLDAAIKMVAKGKEEGNADYLKGDFALPALERKRAITKEKAQELAVSLVPGAVLKEEKEGYYSFDEEGYFLEMGKDGELIYRRRDVQTQGVKLSEDKFTELVAKAKNILKERGYESTVLSEWIYAEGELFLKLYPLMDEVVYMNTPLGVTLSAHDGTLIGLRTLALEKREVKSDEELYKRLEEIYEEELILKAIGTYGEGAYLVSYKNGGEEMFALWTMDGRQQSLWKLWDCNYGRVAKSL